MAYVIDGPKKQYNLKQIIPYMINNDQENTMRGIFKRYDLTDCALFHNLYP